MNLAIKVLADTKFEVLPCCCLSILNLFPLGMECVVNCKQNQKVYNSLMAVKDFFQQINSLKDFDLSNEILKKFKRQT